MLHETTEEEVCRREIPCDESWKRTAEDILPRRGPGPVHGPAAGRAEDLRRAHKHLGDARGMYIELLCTIGRRTQREAAGILGTGEHAVCKCRRRFRERARAERPVAQKIAALTDKCRQEGNV